MSVQEKEPGSNERVGSGGESRSTWKGFILAGTVVGAVALGFWTGAIKITPPEPPQKAAPDTSASPSIALADDLPPS